MLGLELPGSDGIELINEILQTANIPVIFLSAYGQEEVVARAFDMGAVDYVVKPFSPTEVAARSVAALRKRRMSMQPEPSEPYTRERLTIGYLRRTPAKGRPMITCCSKYGA